MKQGPQVTEALRTREVFDMSQGCQTCNWTDQHTEVKHPAIPFLQMPLMKRTFFRVGQVNRSNTIHFAEDTALWPSQKRSTRL